MRKFSKGLAVAAAVVAMGGISLVAAAEPAGTGSGPPGCGSMDFMHGAWGAGFADPATRLGGLKTELGIRPEQAAAWDAYATTVQDSEAQMQAMHASIDFDALRTMSWQDHQAFMGTLHDKQAQSYKSVKAAAGTLLASLDDAQKSKAQQALPGLAHGGPGSGGHGGMPMMRYGMMPWGGGPR